MSYKRLSGIDNYGSTNNTNVYSHLLNISSEVEIEDDEVVEELEFKKPTRVSAVTVFKYCGATLCLVTMVLSCECLCYIYEVIITMSLND